MLIPLSFKDHRKGLDCPALPMVVRNDDNILDPRIALRLPEDDRVVGASKKPLWTSRIVIPAKAGIQEMQDT